MARIVLLPADLSVAACSPVLKSVLFDQVRRVQVLLAERRLSNFERANRSMKVPIFFPNTRTGGTANHSSRSSPRLDTLHKSRGMASAGSKRGRSAWEDCEDVDELKHHLCQLQQQIEKLRKEKSELTKALKGAEGQAEDQTPEELTAQADKLRKSLRSNLLAQMVYRNKSNTSRIAADIPNLSLS
ncbi:hypothetical protein ABBQ38_014413 [Trebouxia sp. C0009 RCD-2024]